MVVSTAGPLPRERFLQVGTPWRRRDPLWSLFLAAVGQVVVWLGYLNAADKEVASEQLAAALVAVVGATISALGLVGFLVVAFREVRRGQRELEVELRSTFSCPRPILGRSTHDPVGPDFSIAGPVLVTAPPMTLFHRSDCLMVGGKAVVEVTRPDAQAQTLEACKVCEP